MLGVLRLGLLLAQLFAGTQAVVAGDAKSGDAIGIACGTRDAVNCSVVVPELGASSYYVFFQRQFTRGSLESAQRLCAGQVPMAVLELNVLATLPSDCLERIDVLGPPVYPRKGFLFVRAETAGDDFATLVKNVGTGILRVGAGDNDMNDNLTFRTLLDGNPAWKLRVELLTDGREAARQQLLARQLDAVFIMEGASSMLIEEFRNTVDRVSKRPAFKVVSIEPTPEMLSEKFRNWRVYAPTAVAEGWFWKTRSVMTPVVLVLDNELYARRPDLAIKLTETLRTAAPLIGARIGAPPGWIQKFDLPPEGPVAAGRR